MKRFLTIALAVIITSSLILCSCSTNNAGKNVDNDGKYDHSKAEKHYVSISNGMFDVQPNQNYGDTMSINEAGSRLEEVQPKSDNDKVYLASAGGVDISATAVRYVNIGLRDSYANSGLDVQEYKDEIQDKIQSIYKLNAAVHLLSHEFKVGISDRDLDDLYSYIDQFKENYGNEYENIFEQYAFLTPYYFFYKELYNLAFANLREFLYGISGDQKLVDQFYNQVLQEFKDADKIRAKHILISFPDDIEKDANGNIPESAKTQTLEKANEVLKLVNKGQDFDTLIAQYSQDPASASYPYGYIFGKGEMMKSFEDAAYALEEGKTSGLVETPYGYHIILKLPLEDKEAILATQNYIDATFADFNDKILDLSENVKVVYGKDYDKKVEKFLADFNAAAQAEQTTEE